jgi:hypothetical protein
MLCRAVLPLTCSCQGPLISLVSVLPWPLSPTIQRSVTFSVFGDFPSKQEHISAHAVGMQSAVRIRSSEHMYGRRKYETWFVRHPLPPLLADISGLFVEFNQGDQAGTTCKSLLLHPPLLCCLRLVLGVSQQTRNQHKPVGRAFRLTVGCTDRTKSPFTSLDVDSRDDMT